MVEVELSVLNTPILVEAWGTFSNFVALESFGRLEEPFFEEGAFTALSSLVSGVKALALVLPFGCHLGMLVKVMR